MRRLTLIALIIVLAPSVANAQQDTWQIAELADGTVYQTTEGVAVFSEDATLGADDLGAPCVIDDGGSICGPLFTALLPQTYKDLIYRPWFFVPIEHRPDDQGKIKPNKKPKGGTP